MFRLSKPSKHQSGDAFTADERAFVRDAYPALGPAAIARKLGRSRSGVCHIIKQMKESGAIESKESTSKAPPQPPAIAPPADGEDGKQDTLGRLKWVRALLERQLYDAEPTTAARLAKEYRDTVGAIEKIEQAGGGENDLIGQFADILADKLG